MNKGGVPQSMAHKLFVGNVPKTVRQEDIEKVFNTYGKCEVQLMIGRSQSGDMCAFAMYEDPTAAEVARVTLHQKYKFFPNTDQQCVTVVYAKQNPAGKNGHAQQNHHHGNEWGPAPGQPDPNAWGAGFHAPASGAPGYPAGYELWNNPFVPPDYRFNPYNMGNANVAGQEWWQQGNSPASAVGSNFNGILKGGVGKGAAAAAGKGMSRTALRGPLVKGKQLFVGNLPQGTTESDLEHVFSPYGKIVPGSIFVMRGKSQSGHWCGFVEYDKEEDAEVAIATLHLKYKLTPDSDEICVKYSEKNSKGNKGKGSPNAGQ